MLSADGSVGSPHVRVGHRQALNRKGRIRKDTAFLFALSAVSLTLQDVRQTAGSILPS